MSETENKKPALGAGLILMPGWRRVPSTALRARIGDQILINHHPTTTTACQSNLLNSEPVANEWANLFRFDDADQLDIERQRLAAQLRDRLTFADAVDCVCQFWGWRLIGFGAAQSDGDDIEHTVDLEWAHQGDDDHLVRLCVSDSPAIEISGDGGLTWVEVEFNQLCDALGDWEAAR